MQMVCSRYTDALALDLEQGNKTGLHKLYGNRCLAYIKAQRYHEATADAERCIELAPQWPKGYWRLGMALLGLKQTLQAIQAFADCWHLDPRTVPSTCQVPVPLMLLPSSKVHVSMGQLLACILDWGFAGLRGPALVSRLLDACLQVRVYLPRSNASLPVHFHALCTTQRLCAATWHGFWMF